MAAFMAQLANMFPRGANEIRRAILTPEQTRQREDGKRFLEMFKLASIVGAVSTLFFAAVLPNVFTVFLLGLVAFGASEVHKTADNVLEILDKADVELEARRSKENLIKQICKNTFVMGPIIKIINPDFERFVLRP